MSDRQLANITGTVGFVDLDEMNDSEKVTTVSLGLMKDAVKAAEVLSRGTHSDAHVHLVESEDPDENPAVAFSTEHSMKTAVMVASRIDIDD